MNGIFAIVVLGLLAAVAAYDYSDEVYNQMIKQDLDDIESLLEAPELTNVHRRKREEVTTAASSDKTCKKRRFKMCCGEDALERVMEKDRDLKKECFKDVMGRTKEETTTSMYDPFSCERIQKIKKDWTCVIECVGQKKNIVDEQGNFKEKDLLSFYEKQLGQDEWLFKLIEVAFPKCLGFAKNGTAFVRDSEDPLSCSPIPIRMHHCMFKELQLSCPDDKITDQKLCAKIREKLQKNDILALRHHHHDDD